MIVSISYREAGNDVPHRTEELKNPCAWIDEVQVLELWQRIVVRIIGLCATCSVDGELPQVRKGEEGPRCEGELQYLRKALYCALQPSGLASGETYVNAQ